MWRQTSSMSKARSGIRITSAPPAIPEYRAIHPAWRPITSTTRLRWWLSAVVWRRSMASVATCTAVSNPNVMSVAPMSLSILFGTPSTGSAYSPWRRFAAPSVSSPPMAISPSRCSSSSVSAISAGPSSRLNGLVRELPRMVPPRGRMPRMASIVSSKWSASIGPRQPSRNPRIACPWWSTPLRTIARATALSPGQSPPPVRTPNRMKPATYLSLLAALCALALSACGGGGHADETPRVPGHTLTVYASMPRQGASARTADAVGAGARLALADAGGRAGGKEVRLVELDSSRPDGETWDPSTVQSNAKRAADDPTAIAYIGELDEGASAISIPVTNDRGILQVSPGDGLTGLTRQEPGTSVATRPERYYPSGRRTFLRLVPTDLLQAATLVGWARARGAHQVAIVQDERLFGREIANQSRSVAAKLGVGLVDPVEAGRDPTAYPALAKKLAAERPDAVLYTGLGDQNAGPLLTAIQRALPGVPLYAGSGLASVYPLPAGLPSLAAVKPALPARVYGPEA